MKELINIFLLKNQFIIFFLLVVLDSIDEEQQSPSQEIVRPENENNPTYWNKKITELFLVGEMPKEFYDLWNFCSKKCPAHPEGLIFLFYSSVLFNINNNNLYN